MRAMYTVAVFVCLSLVACGDSGDDAPSLSSAGETCAVTGECESGLSCVGLECKQITNQSTCDGYTYQGCCDGQMLRWCENGEQLSLHCEKPQCGWAANEGAYWCDTDGGGDPSGLHPKECSQMPSGPPYTDEVTATGESLLSDESGGSLATAVAEHQPTELELRTSVALWTLLAVADEQGKLAVMMAHPEVVEMLEELAAQYPSLVTGSSGKTDQVLLPLIASASDFACDNDCTPSPDLAVTTMSTVFTSVLGALGKGTNYESFVGKVQAAFFGHSTGKLGLELAIQESVSFDDAVGIAGVIAEAVATGATIAGAAGVGGVTAATVGSVATVAGLVVTAFAVGREIGGAIYLVQQCFEWKADNCCSPVGAIDYCTIGDCDTGERVCQSDQSWSACECDDTTFFPYDGTYYVDWGPVSCSKDPDTVYQGEATIDITTHIVSVSGFPVPYPDGKVDMDGNLLFEPKETTGGRKLEGTVGEDGSISGSVPANCTENDVPYEPLDIPFSGSLSE